MLALTLCCATNMRAHTFQIENNHTYIHTYMRAYTHPHIHTHMHTLKHLRIYACISTHQRIKLVSPNFRDRLCRLSNDRPFSVVLSFALRHFLFIVNHTFCGWLLAFNAATVDWRLAHCCGPLILLNFQQLSLLTLLLLMLLAVICQFAVTTIGAPPLYTYIYICRCVL